MIYALELTRRYLKWSKSNFAASEELVHLAVDGLVVTAACYILGTKEADEIPPSMSNIPRIDQ